MSSQPSQYDLTSQDADQWAWIGVGPKPEMVWVPLEGETGKARKRREQEGWFEKYAPPEYSGVDIGCGPDPLNHSFRRWDSQVYGEADGTVLPGVPCGIFPTVYCSHLLEHLEDPQKAIARWYEVLRPGGHLIIVVPHRDLFEQKKELPSKFNPWHKCFWLPDEEDLPCTKSLKKEVLAAIPGANIVSLRVLDDHYEPGDIFVRHASGEYSIEIIIKKPESEVEPFCNYDESLYHTETSKAHARRVKEGFFEKYCPVHMSGLDIGSGWFPVSPTFRRWDADLGEGDGTYLEGIPPNTFQTVYSSHLLEHLQYPRLALTRWYEVLRPGGYLIVMVPHRDLYEGKTEWPSVNVEHKHFWLPDQEDYPWTKSLKDEVLAAIPNANIVSLRTLDTDGEYSIEIIVHKPEI